MLQRTAPYAEAMLREIKDHIKTTGEPHTWQHHTHSKPVVGSRIVYIVPSIYRQAIRRLTVTLRAPVVRREHPGFPAMGRSLGFPTSM